MAAASANRRSRSLPLLRLFVSSCMSRIAAGIALQQLIVWRIYSSMYCGVMVRFTSSALAACAAAFHVAAGLRSEHHPVLWREHPASPAATPHENLAATPAKANEPQATTEERDANAQERMRRELVSRVRDGRQSGGGLLARIKRLWQIRSERHPVFVARAPDELGRDASAASEDGDGGHRYPGTGADAWADA